MRFTDKFIQKPILSSVVSLFIILLGLRAIMDMNVRQFPEIKNAVINVSTTYVGADADLIQGFITTPLEREIAAAEGIDYLVSTSVAGNSTIEAYLRLDYDPNEALTQIAAQVNKVRSELPENAREPVVTLQVGESVAAMYLAFYSEVLGDNQITDYLVRVVEPQLSTLPGVQRAEILGARTFAMRIWLDSVKMAAYGITGSDVAAALNNNNVLAALGRTKGQMVAIDLTAATDLRDVDGFKQLVIGSDGRSVIRLEDVADVELGAESYESSVSFNGLAATFIGVEVSPDANALDVIELVRQVWDRDIIPQLPQGLSAYIAYDSTEYIENAIDEVVISIVLALAIVVLVIYAFLGSIRSVIIPAVAIPVSLVGTFFLMWLLGFSINLLTLLAMVLAIGVVVDDAIIMLENIHRHIEEGKSRTEAAIQGARELAWPIITMSTTLVAVFLPIGFVGGLTGVLFVEFAFTLAASVILSGVVALTLSPVMCAYILKPHNSGKQKEKSLEQWLDKQFDRLHHAYQRTLHSLLDSKSVVLTFGAIVLVSCYFLFVTSPSELEPAEDQGFVFSILESDSYHTLDALSQATGELNRLVDDVEEVENVFIINGMGGTNSAIAGIVLAPWERRDRDTQAVLENNIQPFLAQQPALNSFALVPPSLPSPGGGTPVEFIIGSTQPFEALQEVVQEILGRAMASGRFIFVDSDLKINRPRQTVEVDREKAALMGVSMQQIAADLGSLLSGADTGRFSLDNRSYRVIPQVERKERLNPDQLTNYYTRNNQGELVPLSALVTLTESVQPQALRGFQQLNAVKISGVPRPGVPLGEALGILDTIAAETLPAGFSVDYAGQSRQYKSEGQQLVVTFFFALIVIFLILAAQFESFKNAIIIMVTVPMSVCGALIFTSLGFTSINIYTQVGLLTLVGLIAKHGILIVEFANQLQMEGRSKRDAVEQATAIRLRPILMTTAATVLAMIPLLIATGAGAGSRYAMGLVIASGMTIGTLFTLFVVPAMYLLLAKEMNQHGESLAVQD
ncbi:efflux RND transporter permease subunit [Vibrio cincinnatiensis]|uniref:Multidrug efflux pump n=1 Tax=Vibrio cincinnatiensis DSM 19608 TaxID=1123491 RepID=A0A1T4KWB1_VIBCI|nr:efflux RND transporter permease subunit [Vibrio cincinnatiensis]MCG3733495.1 multidrug efflux protein [Vibrio cincinnatiensis]MCG3740825.1 multidrug efflux protein [Vibrio cincinnatiensis]MCG3744361.1 multidrug efflux protein [Vibrio cincinnatiensis]MCG3747950.1 multidrug efflux protein [Vibrio cincinnatiensis]SJZ46696.1 multidrug efflux pump [Vibrio cincinnatiensis DSM 19608]